MNTLSDTDEGRARPSVWRGYVKSAAIGGLAGASIAWMQFNVWVLLIMFIPGCLGGLVAEFVWRYQQAGAPTLRKYAIRTLAAVTLAAGVAAGPTAIVCAVGDLFYTGPRCSGMHLLGSFLAVASALLISAWGAFIVSVVWWLRSPGGTRFLEIVKSLFR